MDYNEQQSYFADVPQGLANSGDTLVLLDDGTKLPAHAAILARSSGVFSGMLDGDPWLLLRTTTGLLCLSASAQKMWPTSFSRVVYTGKCRNHITESSAWDLASLGHKLNMKVNNAHLSNLCQSRLIAAGLLIIVYVMDL